MATLPTPNSYSRGTTDSPPHRIGHVYLDVRRRLLHYLNVRAKQLHQEGVPFLPRDLRRFAAQKLTGEPLTRDDLPLLRAQREGRPEESIFLVPRESGPAWHVTWNAAPMHNGRGEVVGVFGSVSVCQPGPDWHALAGLAHDLRAPLHALKLLVALLERDNGAGGDQATTVDRIRIAADRALGIGLELLEWCRGPNQEGRRAESAWFDLEPFLLEIIHEQSAAAEQKSLVLLTQLGAADGWQIYADRMRLGRLLANLLVNAIAYTAAGSVQFRADWQSEGAGRTLSLGVVDTGAGISSEEQESIFQPFGRGRAGRDSDPEGSGLGLAVVERLVDELGLELEVFSEFGRGSAFHLLVPLTLLRRAGEPSSAQTTDEIPAAKEDTAEQPTHELP